MRAACYIAVLRKVVLQKCKSMRVSARKGVMGGGY